MEMLQRMRIKRYLRWLPVGLWAGVIFVGSSVPGTNLPGGYSLWGHLGEYLVLGALTAWALRRDDWGTILLAIGLCAIYGASDEFHQAFVPYRMPDIFDWIADVSGAAIGVAVYLLLSVRGEPRTP